jgi:hypothetical protein
LSLSFHPFVLCKEVHDFLYKGDIDPKQTVTGWGGNMIGFECADSGCFQTINSYRQNYYVKIPVEVSSFMMSDRESSICHATSNPAVRPV